MGGSLYPTVVRHLRGINKSYLVLLVHFRLRVLFPFSRRVLRALRVLDKMLYSPIFFNAVDSIFDSVFLFFLSGLSFIVDFLDNLLWSNLVSYNPKSWVLPRILSHRLMLLKLFILVILLRVHVNFLILVRSLFLGVHLGMAFMKL